MADRLDGALLHEAWLRSGRPDPLGDPDAWDGYALTVHALLDYIAERNPEPAPLDGERLAAPGVQGAAAPTRTEAAAMSPDHRNPEADE